MLYWRFYPQHTLKNKRVVNRQCSIWEGAKETGMYKRLAHCLDGRATTARVHKLHWREHVLRQLLTGEVRPLRLISDGIN